MNSTSFIHSLNIRKNSRLLWGILFLSFSLFFLLLSFGQRNKTFAEFTQALFLEEITSNTLNLHYSIENPENYGISSYHISLGDLSLESHYESLEQLQETREQLAGYPYLSLTTEERLTYDILEDYLRTQLNLSNYYLYQEPLSSSGGYHMELPILYAEYDFNTKQDVEDYLELISLTDEYFEQILEFEEQKCKAGLFMSDTQCQRVIESCESFLENKNSHYLLSTFEKRLENLDISNTEIKSYLNKNSAILENQLFPAYENLIAELSDMLGSGKNSKGLAYFPEGKDYYKTLVYAYTGSFHSPEKLFEKIEEQRNADLFICSSLQIADSKLLEKCNALDWEMTDPVSMVTCLQDKILADFPAPPESSYEINYVDEDLEKYLAPAFYIVAPLDNYLENVIYINNAYVSTDLYGFTTLAHEGYPGHLYQTVMSYEYELPEIRSILNYPGFVEGWATYIEMMSYYYADLEENVASMLSHNQAATLSLYASSDIGLHYYGWNQEDMYDFWSSFGITNTSVIDEITQLILSEPGNYLKYYIGYLEFLELQEQAKIRFADDFSLKSFHTALLDIGPAPFSIVEKYLGEYYSPQT